VTPVDSRRDLTSDFWRDLALKLPASSVVVDVGSHLLEEARQLVPLLTRVSWTAFEPHVECHRHSLAVASSLRAPGKTIVVECSAVGDFDGDVTLYRSRKSDGGAWTASSSTRRPKNVLTSYPWLEFDQGVRVRSVRLDAYFLGRRLAVDLLKMDVQGAEADVIRGGQSVFAGVHYVLTEVCESEEYEGQLGLSGLIDLLPGRWSVAERLLNDALIVNEDFGR